MIDINTLLDLYSISSKSGHEEAEMIPYLEGVLTTMAANQPSISFEIKNKNIYVTKGSGPYPAIIAHTDQVQTTKNVKAFVCGDVIIGLSGNESAGIGADDKNGIYIALKALESFDDIKVALFHGEESGCVGSSAADMDFFTDCRFVIQCDRRGNSDFANEICSVKCCSDEFLEDCNIEAFGYKTCNGGLTDAKTLKVKGLEVSCCNMSCGYYNPHSDHETCNIKDLDKCMKLAFHILSLQKVYPHKYEAPTYSHSNYYGGHYGSLYGFPSYASSQKKEEKASPVTDSCLGYYDYDWDEDDAFDCHRDIDFSDTPVIPSKSLLNPNKNINITVNK